MTRKKFHVEFTIEADEDIDSLTCAAVRDHVSELEWVGGCQHPDAALHSNKNIKVAAVKVRVSARPKVEPGKWLVWSNEHRAWWRAKSQGYTVHRTAAGLYTRDEAIAICRGAYVRGHGHKPSEIPVRLVDAIASEKTETKGTQS